MPPKPGASSASPLRIYTAMAGVMMLGRPLSPVAESGLRLGNGVAGSTTGAFSRRRNLRSLSAL